MKKVQQGLYPYRTDDRVAIIGILAAIAIRRTRKTTRFARK